LKEEQPADVKSMVEFLLEIYQEAKTNKNYDRVDMIRAKLKTQGIILKDMKAGVDWAYEE
jgi:cysteinyl-tRNA synthetase